MVNIAHRQNMFFSFVLTGNIENKIYKTISGSLVGLLGKLVQKIFIEKRKN